MDRRAGASKGSDSVPRTSLGGDPLAVAAIVAAMLPALVGAALLLFGVHDPLARSSPRFWAIARGGEHG